MLSNYESNESSNLNSNPTSLSNNNMNKNENELIGLLKLIKIKEFRHELFISIILQISQQLSGYYAVNYFNL